MTAARHFAAEVLTMPLTNHNYTIRGFVIRDFPDVVDLVLRSLKEADASEGEWLRFLFDALERYKYGCYVTSYEPLIEEPLYGDYGRTEQRSCMDAVHNMKQAKTYMSSVRYRDVYPRLSVAGKVYFRRRYRTIFGFEYEDTSEWRPPPSP